MGCVRSADLALPIKTSTCFHRISDQIVRSLVRMQIPVAETLYVQGSDATASLCPRQNPSCIQCLHGCPLGVKECLIGLTSHIQDGCPCPTLHESASNISIQRCQFAVLRALQARLCQRDGGSIMSCQLCGHSGKSPARNCTPAAGPCHSIPWR